MKRTLLLTAFCAALLPASAAFAQQADRIRIGFMTTLSGPIATLGKEQEMGLDLALKQLGGKIGGIHDGGESAKPHPGNGPWRPWGGWCMLGHAA